MPEFDPHKDIPDLAGKVCLVTGGNSGLGEATVAALIQHNPQKLYLAARSRTRAEEAIERIKKEIPDVDCTRIDIVDLDLGSFESTKTAAARINAEAERLDIPQLNAGVGAIPAATTKEGYEIHFGTNYLGHALFTQLLMPKLLKTAELPDADVRIISMSSIFHRVFTLSEGILFEELKTDMAKRGALTLYGQTNLCKALFAYELAKKFPQITSVSVHLGFVKSNIWKGQKAYVSLVSVIVNFGIDLLGISNPEGAETQLWASFSKDIKNGSYYEPIGVSGREGRNTANDELSTKLCDWTEKELLSHGAAGWNLSKPE